MKKTFLGAGVAMIALVLSGCGSDSSSSTTTSKPEASTSAAPEQTRLESALSHCSISNDRLGDDGASATFDTKGSGSNDTIEDIACMAGELNMPDYVVDQVDSTTSLMGRQDGEWDGFKASWTYHPDNGLELVVFDSEA